MDVPTATPVDEILEVSGIEKSFPGVRALQGVSISFAAGRIHAVCGENGAGKSTLMHILAGAYHADAGEIRLRGKPVQIASQHEANQLGISIVYQERSLVPSLTVGENIFRRPPTAASIRQGGLEEALFLRWRVPIRVEYPDRSSPDGQRHFTRAAADGGDCEGVVRESDGAHPGRTVCRGRRAGNQGAVCPAAAPEESGVLPSSTSPTGWRRSSRSPTSCRFSRTAHSWGPK